MCSWKATSLNALCLEELCFDLQMFFSLPDRQAHAHTQVFIFSLPLKYDSKYMHSSAHCWLSLNKDLLVNTLEE